MIPFNHIVDGTTMEKINKTIIYKLTTPNSKFIYIGSSKVNLSDIIKYHKYNYNKKGNISSNKLFQVSDQVDINIIERCFCDQDNVAKRRTYWINFYKNNPDYECVNKHTYLKKSIYSLILFKV